MFPHLDHEVLPEYMMAHAKKWGAVIGELPISLSS